MKKSSTPSDLDTPGKPPKNNPRPPSSDRQLMAYIFGWRKGASAAAYDCSEMSDPDFKQGWEDGNRAKKDAYASACSKYGTKLNPFRARRATRKEM